MTPDPHVMLPLINLFPAKRGLAHGIQALASHPISYAQYITINTGVEVAHHPLPRPSVKREFHNETGCSKVHTTSCIDQTQPNSKLCFSLHFVPSQPTMTVL